MSATLGSPADTERRGGVMQRWTPDAGDYQPSTPAPDGWTDGDDDAATGLLFIVFYFFVVAIVAGLALWADHTSVAHRCDRLHAAHATTQELTRVGCAP